MYRPESMLWYRMTVWARQVMRVREWGHVFGTFPGLLAPEEKLQ